jgi:hypothetical protein
MISSMYAEGTQPEAELSWRLASHQPVYRISILYA